MIIFKEWILNNIGLKSVSILIAIVLWFVVRGSRTEEVTKEFPIEIVTPANLMVTGEVPTKVNYRLVGSSIFLKSILNNRDVPIRVDLSTAEPGLTNFRFVPDQVSLPLGVKVIGITPLSIQIRLEEVRERDLPVRVKWVGDPPQGVRVTRIDSSCPRVKVKAPKALLRGIQELQTAPIDLSTLFETTLLPLKLEIPAGVTVADESCEIRVNVTGSIKQFRIKDVPVRVVTDRRFELRTDKVTVFLTTLDQKPPLQMTEGDLSAEINLEGRNPGIYDEKPVVIGRESWHILRTVPETVQVEIF